MAAYHPLSLLPRRHGAEPKRRRAAPRPPHTWAARPCPIRPRRGRTAALHRCTATLRHRCFACCHHAPGSVQCRGGRTPPRSTAASRPPSSRRPLSPQTPSQAAAQHSTAWTAGQHRVARQHARRGRAGQGQAVVGQLDVGAGGLGGRSTVAGGCRGNVARVRVHSGDDLGTHQQCKAGGRRQWGC